MTDSQLSTEPVESRPVFGMPSPASASEPHLRARGDGSVASWRAEGASTAACTVRAASVAGVRHRLAGQGSDDSFAWAHDGDRLAVAVADGVGSVPGAAGASHRAATAAVEAALTAAADRDPTSAVLAAVEAANRAAAGGGASTVVVALVGPADGGRLGVALARVGDSTAVIVDGDGTGEELFRLPDPDRAGTATAALPADDPAVETAVAELDDASVLALLTDGIGDPWRDGPTTVAPAMVSGLLDRPSPPELLRLADFSRRGCHDDRTLLCVWARTAPDGPAPPAGGA